MTEVLKWIDGSGLLILSGGADELSDIRAQAISRIRSEGAIVYISMDESHLDDLIDDFGELGAPTGYLLNIVAEDDETIRDSLATASMIVLPSIYDASELKAMLVGAGVEGIRGGYERGAVVFAEGEAASIFGKFILSDTEQPANGLDWIENSIIMPGMSSVSESPRVHQIITAKSSAVAIGIGDGSALVLGEDGHIETWGDEGLVTVALIRD